MQIQPFVIEVLNEALVFTDTLMHTQFNAKGKPQTSAPSTAKVQLLTFDVMQQASGRSESWFGRRSVHEDAVKDGTASWAEFEEWMFNDHNANEARYTPEVFDARQLLKYGAAEGLDSAALREAGWEDVHVELFEMGHRIPSPLSNRVFPALAVRGRVRADKPPLDGVKDANGFVTAQIPVDLSNSPAAFYSNGKNRTEGGTEEQKAKVVMGEYVSVERIRKQADGEIVWEMATASDAKGNLPMAMQKLGVPAAIVKDVSLFVKWRQEERKKTSG